MLRLSRLADYGFVLLTQFARHEQGAGVLTARDAASEAGLPQPTVSKLLKELAQAGLLVSHRGAKGGYTLARPAARITVAEIIAALDGPIAITECGHAEPGSCEREGACPVRVNWQRINQTVHSALAGITLADMVLPHEEHLVHLGGANAAEARLQRAPS